jgi:hypothetical protein
MMATSFLRPLAFLLLCMALITAVPPAPTLRLLDTGGREFDDPDIVATIKQMIK